jgi:ABC-2 type transport system permease protein
MRSLTTIFAFAGKEIRQVLRQPRLMVALIVGPFIILGLFAAGFQANPPPLRSVLVLPEDSGLEERIPQISEALDGDMEVIGVEHDVDLARERLDSREVDLVVIAPEDAVEIVRSNEHAPIVVLHDRLDPFDRAFITVAAQSAVDELNRVVLSEVTEVAQSEAGEYEEALPAARSSMGRMAEALRRGDETEARAAQSDAIDSLQSAEEGLGSSSDLLASLERSVGSGSQEPVGGRVGETRSEVESLDTADPAAADRAEEIEADLAELEQTLGEFRSISPEVLVQPFVAETELVRGQTVPLTTYYSPGVVAVLLQHVVLTFAALSVVGERQTGSTELFRVGPVRVGEFLAGKFLGYAFLGSIIAAGLMAVVIFVFGTPMFGSPWWAIAVLALTMSASLGLGFVIAAAANSDAQAVQFSMMALLFTIFFSGMVVSLSRLADGVRQVAYLAPATAGTAALQDVMLLGAPPAPIHIGILVIYTLVAFVLAYVWLNRRRVA